MPSWIAFLVGAWIGSTLSVAVVGLIALKYRDGGDS